MHRKHLRRLASAVALIVVASGCGGGGEKPVGSSATRPPERIDYAALGLWDDGPCDGSRPPLKVGIITTIESPVLSLGDQVDALKAAAAAFNGRGGANGACIEVLACDDKASVDSALACARRFEREGVVVTVNDQQSAGQAEAAEVLAAGLAATGDAKLQPENLTTRSMRSWIGLYALLRILRDADVKDPTRRNVAAAVRAAKEVPMLGIYGEQTWTPDTDYPGLFKRAGMPRWHVLRWDSNATFGASKGNFKVVGTLDIDEVLCGTPLGATGPC